MNYSTNPSILQSVNQIFDHKQNMLCQGLMTNCVKVVRFHGNGNTEYRIEDLSRNVETPLKGSWWMLV